MENMVKGMTVFVTGGTGLIGSWLLDELVSRGAHVVALERDEVPDSWVVESGVMRHITRARGALESFADMSRIITEYQPELIFHLGAQTQVTTARVHPLATYEANVRGTWNLLEAIRVYGSGVQGVVVASSDKAYGESDTLPYGEDHPLHGRFPYDASKSCVDLISQSYALTYKLPVTIARCGNVYGGGDLNWDRIVPGTIRSVLRNERPVIRSDGTFLRDYIYVKDIAGAYIALGEAILTGPEIAGEAFNFGLDAPVSVLKLVDEILRLMGRTDLVADIRNTAKAEIKNQYLSSEKARARFGWKPTWGLENGLSETIGWYKRYFGGKAGA